MTNRTSISIHGHFYQPDRSDPKYKSIPREESAGIFDNWNRRINHECYKPNADLSNFEWMSFDTGPTLLSWLERFDPETYTKIIDQEQGTCLKYGVGNGMAQPYHHTILPLADPIDRRIQVEWGIRDFEHRFGHRPAGMWLPECAVNEATLEELAAQGIEFTILAPWQCSDMDVDPEKAYLVNLPSGRQITIFFYDSGLSSKVSFDPIATEDAVRFLDEFGHCRNPNDHCIRIVASDGELYGHHRPFREKFLSHLISAANETEGLEVIYPGKWLQEHKAQEFATVLENTSWSCHHGIKRWSAGCECTPNSEWKFHFRKAADSMAHKIDEVYVDCLDKLQLPSWELLTNYVDVVMGVRRLEEIHAGIKDLRGVDKLRLEQLLEAQWNKHRMFSSCAWFFEDFARIEPRNSVMCLAYSIWLLRNASGIDLSIEATQQLDSVVSSRSSLTGSQVFTEYFKTLDAFISTGWG
ncbi:MAG TPA: DUF3536 domain-containing protein [Bellilinea sp.]|nr:DUF3536 domain-containing protein [Bellilinea sp.]